MSSRSVVLSLQKINKTKQKKKNQKYTEFVITVNLNSDVLALNFSVSFKLLYSLLLYRLHYISEALDCKTVPYCTSKVNILRFEINFIKNKLFKQV